MPVPDTILVPMAYIGPGSGLEFLPYFLSLLVLAGTALAAVVQWPFVWLRRRLSRANGDGGGTMLNDRVEVHATATPGDDDSPTV